MNRKTAFEKSPWKSILSLSLPALVSILVMMLYNMADMYFIAWSEDLNQIAAVSIAGPVFSLLMAVSQLIGNGCCTVVARAMGQKDQEKIRDVSAVCVWASIGFGLAFTVICLLMHRPLLSLIGATEETWEYTRIYVLIMAAGAPAVLLNHSLGAMLRGQGLIRESMIGSLISTVANILLDPLFIVTLNRGVAGAAIATVLGNIFSIAWFLLLRRKGRCTISSKTESRHAFQLFGRILSLGLPNAVSSLLSGFAGTFSNRLLVGYGTSAVAAMAAAGKGVMIVTMIPMGICMGVQPLLAYCCGGENWPRLRSIISRVIIMTVSLGLILSGLLWLFRTPLIEMFIKEPDALALGIKVMGYQLVMGPFTGFYYLSSNLLQAMGKARAATFTSALRQGILLIPLMYLMNHLFSLTGLVLAHTIADAFAILITALLAFHALSRLETGNAAYVLSAG